MSAFVVGDKTINQVISWISDQPANSVYHRKVKEAFNLDPMRGVHCGQLAQEMLELNIRAVRQRYEDADQAQMIPDGGTWSYELTSSIQAYKSLRCFLYQCAEGDVPETSILYNILDELSDEMAHDIVCDLPEYEKAKWDD